MNRESLFVFSTRLRVSSVVCVTMASVVMTSLTACIAQGALTTENLRCEYLVNPLGIQESAPRLSWIVQSTDRGEFQTGYRVLAASSETKLKKNAADLWDSGKVASDETTSIVYSGKPLSSGQRCYWKLKVWDKDGNESGWSKPALWSMGLLQPSDWKAEWIGFDKGREIPMTEAEFGSAKWIWHAADSALKVPKCHRLFVSSFVLPDQVMIESAELIVAADDNARFIINGRQVCRPLGCDQAFRANLRHQLKPGRNDIRVQVENGTPSPAGLVARIEVVARDGKTFTHQTDGTWKSAQTPGTNWPTRDIDAGAWPAVRVEGNYGMQPWGRLKVAQLLLPPPAFVRTNFKAEKAIARATIYATALGLFDLYLNGKRVSEDYFNPGWTDYDKRVHYRSYDVTRLVQGGDNALGAIIADGWFSGYVGGSQIRHRYGKQPRVRAQLEIEYNDGSRAIVATGKNWKAAFGPTQQADFLMGETYDARRAVDGWDTSGFDDSKWSPVDLGSTEVQPKVEAHPGPPVRAIAEFKAKSITEPTPGVYVFDLGQNFAGVPRLKIRGKPGQKIVLRFAERLNPDGTVYTINLRGAMATDTYICNGRGVEVWQPRFTFHGFQYIEVKGLTRKPDVDTVIGVALSSDTPVAGRFECSHPMLNQLHSNAYWTQRMNFIDVPTDCPQRDERLGWTGDAQIYIRTATLNTDVQAFFTKWLVDLCQDGQRADGQFPMIAPSKFGGPDGGPAWADAAVICPWTIYEVYGDKRILERHYQAMTRFIAFCEKRCKPSLLPPDKYHCFGDWLSINADTPKDVIHHAYFAYSTKLMARVAEVLGKKEDASKYNELFNQIKASFNKAYVADDGRIQGDTQACYVLALTADLVEGEKARKAADYLVENIRSRDWHLSTGFIGTKDLMLALAKIGRNDVAYRLVYNDSFPSWGFSIKHGATSIWERWDGWTPEQGFQDTTMNSFAHYSFGAVYQWMVENIGGIRNETPSYKKILIAPQLDGKLTHANVSYDSIRGRIQSSWRIDGNKLTLKVCIPANTSASVFVPAKDTTSVTESGKTIGKSKGVKLLRLESDQVVLGIGSGDYVFESTSWRR